MVERVWLRPQECAETLGLSRSTTYRLLAENMIPSVRVGRTLRVPAQGLREWAEKMVAGQRQFTTAPSPGGKAVGATKPPPTT